ncbi:MAG: sterol desaturase family protein [Mesorhizobium sp.]|uniref:sterol desaturase family protein n=1 Tax=unclassified Mesorhizobium TaxID=325217 RepID=UPI000F74E388|nr:MULTISPECIES: sterol desaturase family protein [unclassified Mesorhizobium]AZO47858.1 sterol desaturase family protein [Mesorhizobium sp. M4B.F.Ca.ET.058.02.1.1]RVC44336.1 sterol desaturase family protein [Mesorhizobium sp. M4A.F.Ca.ET.090.04.2.1]RWC40820.1 MAG: sterol desaturase family protein [Mesorhizobium sp.]RWD12110.1 MAG: sterol desaturase family protein [Mesorhizobium sp.]RWD54404.1 MAG: sterol desaturase family protein [Mesorhizobium sp.]
MDDLQYGTRNKRGDWAPNEPAGTAPLFVFPPRPLAVLKWLPSYFLPYNVLFALSAVAWWHFVLPDAEVMKTLSVGWILRLFLVNCAALLVFFGVFELRLYILRAQGNRFKYNGKWPSEQKSQAFFFENQNLDNMLRTFGTGMPIWTAIEVALLYAYANGYVPWLTVAEHPVYLFCLALVVPIIHETHFFLLHRAIHWPPLYKWVHSVHHNSVNPSPWSSLSMHPVEQLGYLGVALWHLIIPSNPLLALYQLHYAGFGAIPGHVGFDKVELGENTSVDSHAYIHYLHHKHFEVNYGDGLIPFDRWFGTFHDGSKDGEARMQARYEKKKARANAAAK